MEQAWRNEYESALCRVLSRGNQWQSIFVEGEDRQMFLDTLCEMAQRFEIEIWAYVMTVHENFC